MKGLRRRGGDGGRGEGELREMTEDGRDNALYCGGGRGGVTGKGLRVVSFEVKFWD